MKSIFKKSVIISLIILSANHIKAQDSIVKNNYHVVGVGAQMVLPVERMIYTNFKSLAYNQSACSIFYRYFFPFTSGKSMTSANLYATYRSADAGIDDVSHFGTSHYQSRLEMYRFDVGLSRLAVLGKRKGFQIGGGFGLGGLIYSSGNLKENLYKVNFYANFEMNQRLKVSEKCCILLGSKSQLESADGFGYLFGISETLFLAYIFK